MLSSALSKARELREYWTPVSHVSSFKKTGEITPEEFVTAGDYLVYKFPTWSWARAPPSKQKDYLPKNKQYLVTKHVASHARSDDLLNQVAEAGETVDDDGWVVQDDAGVTASTKSSDVHKAEQVVDIDSIEDEEESDEDVVYNAQPSRTYNLYIAYSTAYRVPKFYLSGFNPEGTPLSPEEMFEDIINDYKDKTVTVENAPFEEDLTLISIHPCRHANVMRILLDRTEARLKSKKEEQDITEGIAKVGLADNTDEDEWQEIDHTETQGSEDMSITVDQYLVIFLKFVASVTPGIEHDNTMAF